MGSLGRGGRLSKKDCLLGGGKISTRYAMILSVEIRRNHEGGKLWMEVQKNNLLQKKGGGEESV